VPSKQENSYQMKVTEDFHERRQLSPFKTHSDRGQTSIQKRLEFIQQECNKFFGAIENVVGRLVSGIGFANTVRPQPFLN
jgi:hypothetical protein